MPEDYKVGQILYIVSAKTEKVLPIQICEVINRRTIAGEETNFVCRMGDKNQTFALTDVKGKIFDDLNAVRAHLREYFEIWLNKQIDLTEQTANEWFTQRPLEIPIGNANT